MKYLLMVVLSLAGAAVPAGPCACALGKVCSWSGTDYSGSHEEHQVGDEHVGETTVTRSLLNKTLVPVVVSGHVAGRETSFCLDPGLGHENTGPFLIAKVAASPTPCP